MKSPLALECLFLAFLVAGAWTSSLSKQREPVTSENDSDSDQDVCWDIRADDGAHTPCAGEGFFLKPDCQTYYRCVKIGPHLHSFEFDCGEGSVFVPEKSSCLPVVESAEKFLLNCTGAKSKDKKGKVKRDLAEASDSDIRDFRLQETISMLNRSLCRSEEDAFEHPTDCSRYMSCVKSSYGQFIKVDKRCPVGEMFDEYSDRSTSPCVNPTSMSTKARCFEEAEKVIESLLQEKGSPKPEVDPGAGDDRLQMTTTAAADAESGELEIETDEKDNYGNEESEEEPDVEVDHTPSTTFVNETTPTNEGPGGGGDRNKSDTTTTPKDKDLSGLTPAFVFSLFSRNHEITIMICILLFILLITTCFFCCYMLRSIYHCVFLKSPAKTRSRLSNSATRNSEQKRAGSSRKGGGSSRAWAKSGGGSFRRFQTSSTNFLDSHTDTDTEKGAIELKRVMFITDDSECDQGSLNLFLPPPPPHQCSTFATRVPPPRHGTSLIQGQGEGGPWHVEHSTSVTTTTDVIVNVNHPRQCHVEKAATAAVGGRRKRVEIYIPNLNLPNAVEPLHVRTFFAGDSEGMDRLDMDENYFSIMESKELKFGYLGHGEQEAGGDWDHVMLPDTVLPDARPLSDAVYEAVIPKSQRVAHISPFTATASKNSTPDQPEGECQCEAKGEKAANSNAKSADGEKRLSSFGKPLNSVLQDAAKEMTMTAGQCQSKKSSIIVMDQLEDGRVLEYFF